LFDVIDVRAEDGVSLVADLRAYMGNPDDPADGALGIPAQRIRV